IKNAFLLFFCLIFCIVALLVVYLLKDYDKERAEKAQELKKMEEIIEQARKRKEEEKKRQKLEKQKKIEEEYRQKLEKRRKIEEEFRKKREEERQQIELARKEIYEIHSNMRRRYEEYRSMSEDELIKDFYNTLSIIEKFKSIKGFFDHNYTMLISIYIRMALDKDYPNLLEEIMNKKYFSPNNWKFNYMPTVFYLAEKDSRKCLDLIIDDCDLKEELVSEKDKKIYENDDKYKIEEGLTLLHLAAKRGNLPLAKKVLEAGVSVNKKTKEGITPIDYAIKNNQLEMVKFLIENKAEVNPETISLASDSTMIRILRQTR
ncbi:MAG: ankyrin repeat domain-containing protein, partial [Candidatus Riflebacteria bacterium]|nr:ankyrin repeat domain-containing protein [Candidatus Riflebacteria bacterium]